MAHQLQLDVFTRLRTGPRPAAASRKGVRGERQGEGVTVAKEDRGFASMDPSKQHTIASMGGKAAHQKGTAHEWTTEEAREAGRKGGMASHRRKQEQRQNAPPNVNAADEQMVGNEGLR